MYRLTVLLFCSVVISCCNGGFLFLLLSYDKDPPTVPIYEIGPLSSLNGTAEGSDKKDIEKTLTNIVEMFKTFAETGTSVLEKFVSLNPRFGKIQRRFANLQEVLWTDIGRIKENNCTRITPELTILFDYAAAAFTVITALLSENIESIKSPEAFIKTNEHRCQSLPDLIRGDNEECVTDIELRFASEFLDVLSSLLSFFDQKDVSNFSDLAQRGANLVSGLRVLKNEFSEDNINKLVAECEQLQMAVSMSEKSSTTTSSPDAETTKNGLLRRITFNRGDAIIDESLSP
jgi:predicted outer membrane lipoprotein